MTVEQVYSELQGFYSTAAEKQQLRKNLEQIYPTKSAQGKVGKKYLNPKYIRSFKLQDPEFTRNEFEQIVTSTYRGARLGDMYGNPSDYRSIYYNLRQKIKSGKVSETDIIHGRKRYVFGVGQIPDSVVNQMNDYAKLRGWLKSGLDVKDTTLAYKGWEDAAWRDDIADQLRKNGIRWSSMPSDQQSRLSRLLWYLIKNKPVQAGQTVSWG